MLMFEPVVANLTIGAARLLTGIEGRCMSRYADAGPRIYFANHTSHIDFVLLWAALPRRTRDKTRPVAATDYWNHGLMRRYMIQRVFHGVLVDRVHPDRTHNPITSMVEALDRGESLILFPEGTRGDGDSLLPFKCGLFHLAAARPDVDLVPVWIDNAGRVMPKGAALPVPLLCSAIFGEPTRLASGEHKTDFLARMRQVLLDLSSRHISKQ
jgi:1-acyl-sn-glycerol-3-phosphate acyltransferase